MKSEPRTDLTQLDGVLADNEVHVWHTNPAVSENTVRALTGLLDSGELDRASRFKFPDIYRQFVLSHAFLRIVLSRYLQIEARDVHFQTSSHGKPELQGSSGLRFNLSHTESAAVVAITRARRVGVDVERIREDLEPVELADRFFSPQESQWLRSRPAALRYSAFFECWTAKEAYIKACGEGLSRPLASFGVSPESGTAKLRLESYDHAEDSKRWSLWQLDLGQGLRGAVAVEAENFVVRLGHWSFAEADNV